MSLWARFNFLCASIRTHFPDISVADAAPDELLGQYLCGTKPSHGLDGARRNFSGNWRNFSGNWRNFTKPSHCLHGGPRAWAALRNHYRGGRQPGRMTCLLRAEHRSSLAHIYIYIYIYISRHCRSLTCAKPLKCALVTRILPNILRTGR